MIWEKDLFSFPESPNSLFPIWNTIKVLYKLDPATLVLIISFLIYSIQLVGLLFFLFAVVTRNITTYELVNISKNKSFIKKGRFLFDYGIFKNCIDYFNIGGKQIDWRKVQTLQ